MAAEITCDDLGKGKVSGATCFLDHLHCAAYTTPTYTVPPTFDLLHAHPPSTPRPPSTYSTPTFHPRHAHLHCMLTHTTSNTAEISWYGIHCHLVGTSGLRGVRWGASVNVSRRRRQRGADSRCASPARYSRMKGRAGWRRRELNKEKQKRGRQQPLPRWNTTVMMKEVPVTTCGDMVDHPE